MQEWHGLQAGTGDGLSYTYSLAGSRERERVSRLCDDAINSESPPPVTYFL